MNPYADQWQSEQDRIEQSLSEKLTKAVSKIFANSKKASHENLANVLREMADMHEQFHNDPSSEFETYHFHDDEYIDMLSRRAYDMKYDLKYKDWGWCGTGPMMIKMELERVEKEIEDLKKEIEE